VADSDKDLQIALLIRTEMDRAIGDLRRFHAEAKNSFRETGQSANVAGVALGGLEKLLGIFGIAFSVDGVIRGLRAITSEAAEAERVEGRMQAVLEATGRSAAVSGSQLIDLSAQISASTRFTENDIKSAITRLLTFNNISQFSFEETLKMAAGLATVLETDLGGAVEHLGRVLNDPIGQLGSLSRAGITFTEVQKEMIERMARTGNVAGAQARIFEELRKRGLGSAAGGENTGLFKATSDVTKNWNNMLEAIGRTPTFERTASVALKGIATVLKVIEDSAKRSSADLDRILGKPLPSKRLNEKQGGSLSDLNSEKLRKDLEAAGLASGGTIAPELTFQDRKARLEVVRANLEAQTRLTEDQLKRQQEALDRQLQLNLVSYHSYFSRVTELQQAAADAEIHQIETTIAQEQEALKSAVDEKDKAGILSQIAKLQADLTIARRKRAMRRSSPRTKNSSPSASSATKSRN
jgi:hypothetical protein